MDKRRQQRALELVWRGSSSWGAASDVWTHNYYSGNYVRWCPGVGVGGWGGDGGWGLGVLGIEVKVVCAWTVEGVTDGGVVPVGGGRL